MHHPSLSAGGADSADRGDADPRLAAGLRSLAAGEAGARAEVLAALVGARVFAAITATATAEHTESGTGLRAESSAEMAVVLLEAPDGSRALPVFSDLGALGRWRQDARPVPLTGAQACVAALDERAGAVVLDQAVTVTELATLAAGWVPVTGSALAARHQETALRPAERPAPEDLVLALRTALAGERLVSARWLTGPEGAVLGVAATPELTPTELAGLAQRLVSRLGDRLPAAGLDLAQVPALGPGQELLARPRRLGWLRRDR